MKVLFRNFSKSSLRKLSEEITNALSEDFETYTVSFDCEGYAQNDFNVRTGTNCVGRFYGTKEL